MVSDRNVPCLSMKKTCTISGKEFEITADDLKFYEKMGVTPPTLCWEERQRRRLAWRNERELYWRKCDGSGKQMMSMYRPGSSYKVYSQEYWYSDEWDPRDYGRDFDFSRPFFEQFDELLKDVPQISLIVTQNENCDFVNDSGRCKDCYLIFDAGDCEKCFYCEHVNRCNYCINCSYLGDCELCFECMNCSNCYNCRFVQNSSDCSDSWFLKHCGGCKNCFGCINLRNKQYYFLNEKCTKKEYFRKLAELKLDTHSGIKDLRKSFSEFVKKYPHKHIHGVMNEDCTGDYMVECKNCINCFDTNRSRDCKYTFDLINGKDVYDMNVFGDTGAELCVEVTEIGIGVQNIAFCDQIWSDCYDIFYSRTCVNNSHDLFGCVGFNHGKFCIFNKQYTEKEYHKLRAKIVEHMKSTGEYGEYFPISMSPFRYNETIANEFYPVDEALAKSKGWKWTKEKKGRQPQKIKIPDSIREIEHKICSEVLACEECKKNYKIIKQELDLYKKLEMPAPRICPDCRYHEKMILRNPRQLFSRNCDNCNKEIETSFAPERPEKVYCEKCYLEVVN